jgi:hypothetical protein
MLVACNESNIFNSDDEVVITQKSNNSQQIEEFPNVTFPTPSPQKGVIIGRLISSTDQLPIKNHLIYLGEYLYLTPGPDYLITLQIRNSDHVSTNEQGIFIFTDVEPAQYPMILWTPGQSLVVPEKDSQNELLVDVQAGKTTDLGDLFVVWP